MEMNSKNDFTELEDGEIDFDASLDDIYTPLERPSGNAPVPPSAAVESDLDDNDNCSSTDSDSSCSGPKIKKNNKSTKRNPQNPKKNKLKIWCNVLEGEMVSNNLTDCNLDESQMRIRGLLPYTKRINYSDSCKGNQNSNSGKRSHTGQFVGDKKYFKEKSNSKKGVSKCIQPLSDNMWDSDELLAKEVADKLNEVKTDLILKAIQIAGMERIISIFEETRATEKSGGMLVMNGSRRRTSGGVFFYLLKTSKEIPQEQLKQIFHIDKQDVVIQKKKTARQNQNVTKFTESINIDVDSKVT